MVVKRGYWIVLVVLIIIAIFSVIVVRASGSFDSNDTRQIGYEFLNSTTGNVTNASDGDVVHIWNTKDDYYSIADRSAYKQVFAESCKETD